MDFVKDTITIAGGESLVTITGLTNVDSITEAKFNGITAVLTGAEVKNFSDLVVTGGAVDGENCVRRVIWNGKVDDIERSTVLIVDTYETGKLKGGWLIFGEEQNHLTYYNESSKLTADSTGEIDDDSAEISIHFPTKEAALKQRTFTFFEKYDLVSLGASAEYVTINGSLHKDVYISRTVDGVTAFNGVIKQGATAVKNGDDWSFDDNESFIVATKDGAIKFFGGNK